ncbi:MAG: patatin-like phospholipase family protein [Alphaproteobacteria bacterium]|jgi:NTE family protein|nr:patatin-like phospholipase family protein [Alphaproteobacteria bacterium]
MSQKKYLNLALQGGGSHGAFTWGVLDRLLEEETLKIEGISGTSAGALNAALLATGIVQGGRDKARRNLDEFWRAVSAYALPNYGPATYRTPYDFFMAWSRYMGEFFINLGLWSLQENPLSYLIHEYMDLKCLRDTDQVKIYVCATNVETNQIKVFDNKDLCPQALLASTCLPTLYSAVQWREEYYWDGGYLGNPMLEPLIENCVSQDLLIIQVNPVEILNMPKTPRSIMDRINEVTFNASLMREIRSIVKIQNYAAATDCQALNPYESLRLHHIQDEPFMASLGASTKLNVAWPFISRLKEKGRQAADLWLKNEWSGVGRYTTMDLTRWRMETDTTTCLATLELTKNKKM